jgi:hypothetical protein
MRSPAQERQRQKKAMQREVERRAQLLPNAAHLVGIGPPSLDVQQLRWLQVQCAFRAMFVHELCMNLQAVPELGLLCVATESDATPRVVEIDVPDMEPDESAEPEPPSPAVSRRPAPVPVHYDAWTSVLTQVHEHPRAFACRRQACRLAAYRSLHLGRWVGFGGVRGHVWSGDNGDDRERGVCCVWHRGEQP